MSIFCFHRIFANDEFLYLFQLQLRERNEMLYAQNVELQTKSESRGNDLSAQLLMTEEEKLRVGHLNHFCMLLIANNRYISADNNGDA
jgi:hypothetical protein